MSPRERLRAVIRASRELLDLLEEPWLDRERLRDALRRRRSLLAQGPLGGPGSDLAVELDRRLRACARRRASALARRLRSRPRGADGRAPARYLDVRR